VTGACTCQRALCNVLALRGYFACRTHAVCGSCARGRLLVTDELLTMELAVAHSDP
jgi:hypothetical protein